MLDLDLIHESYRDEMVGAFKILADRVRSGEITITLFQIAQQRIYLCYLSASEKKLAEVAG